jgi:hypothetical protein
MPTTYSEDFDRSVSDARGIDNYESEIAMRLKCITGTPEDAAAAVAERAAFIETHLKNMSAAENVRKKIPDPARVKNFQTLDRDLGEKLGFSARLQEMIASADTDFPELDREDRLNLKRNILSLFSPARQNAFTVGDDMARIFMEDSFGGDFQSGDSMSSVFAKKAGQYHAVLYVDPGTAQARTEYGARSPKAQELSEKVTALYKDVEAASDRHYALMEERREAARAAMTRRATPEV